MDNNTFALFVLEADVVHTNTHNHALVQNPFAWDEEAEEAPEAAE